MHLKSYFITSSHGVIYNRDYVYYYIKKYELGFTKPNYKVWLDLNIIKYTYYKPLCFKLSKNKYLEFFNLNKKHNPGYKIFNIIIKTIYLTILFVLYQLYTFQNYQYLN